MEEFNLLALIAEQIHRAAGQVTRKTALDIQASAQQQAIVDTGFMRSSIYCEFSDGGTYGEGVEGAEAMLPEILRAEDDQTAYVAVGASYATYVEFGTRHMPPKPFLIPAAEAHRAAHTDAMSRLEEALQHVGNS